MKKISFAIAMLLLATNVFAQDIYFEDFENTTGSALPVGWQSTADPGAIWQTGLKSDFAVPMCGFIIPRTESKYAGLKPDVAYQTVAREDVLTFPPIALQSTTTYTTLTLQMDLLFSGSNLTASLEISTNGGSSWQQVQTLPGNAWWPLFITLPTITNSSSLLIRITHSAPALANLCALSIDNIHVYVPQPVDAEVHDITPFQDSLRNFGTTTQGPIVTARVYNRSMNTLQGFVAKFQVANGPVQSETVTGLSLGLGGTHELTFSAPAATPNIGPNQFKVWVDAIGDGDHTNDTFHSVLNGAHFMPVRRPLIEEHGGTWCTWCPRGYVYCDSIYEEYGDLVSIVEIHNQDPMTIQPYDSHLTDYVLGGYQIPGCVYDRREPNDPDQVFVMYDKYKQYFGFGEVDLSNAVLSGNDLSIDASVIPAIDISQEYKFLLVITEDSVHKDTAGYQQVNMYSYQNLNSPMSGFELLPAIVPAADMWYNHVARASVGDITGTPGSLPAMMTHNMTYSYTFNTTLDPAWNLERLSAILMLIESHDSTVVNTIHKQIVPMLSTRSVQQLQDKVNVYPNPAIDMVFISAVIQKTGNVKIALTDIYGRVLKYREFSNVTKGEQSFSLQVDELPSGIYNLQVETSSGTTGKKINIIH